MDPGVAVGGREPFLINSRIVFIPERSQRRKIRGVLLCYGLDDHFRIPHELFGEIIEHETKFKHFDKGNQPVKSHDGGFGLCQLTNPAPSFEQIWNWKLNIDGGLKLFGEKRSAAIAHLSHGGRKYTSDQLKYETVSRWNGGGYHEWDAKAGAWVTSSRGLSEPASCASRDSAAIRRAATPGDGPMRS